MAAGYRRAGGAAEQRCSSGADIPGQPPDRSGKGRVVCGPGPCIQGELSSWLCMSSGKLRQQYVLYDGMGGVVAGAAMVHFPRSCSYKMADPLVALPGKALAWVGDGQDMVCRLQHDIHE